MERSLSVLLPVQNAQFTLSAAVHELLEILPELTSRFELIIIDDGSTDATSEVADDLASRYPQVQRVGHAKPRGRDEAVRTGLRLSTGDVIFLRDENCCLATDELHKLWRAVDDHPLVLGRSEQDHSPGKLVGWKRHGEEGNFRMINRHAMRGLQQSLEEQARLVASLARPARQWHEVEVSRRSGPRGPRATTPPARPTPSERSSEPGPESSSRPPAGRTRVGGYLRGLKNFALGE